MSTAINASVPTAIIWLLRATPPETLFGPHALIQATLGAAGLATFCMTLALTLVIRARVRNGSLPALSWPRSERGIMRWIPARLPVRAVALGLLAIAMLVPMGLAAVAMLGVLPFDRVGFLIFNLIYGGAVGLVMARFVVLPALAD